MNVGVLSLRRAGRAGVDRRVRRGQVDHERQRRGRRVDVAGGVDRADLERVRAGGQRRGRERRGAAAERAAVDRGTGTSRRVSVEVNVNVGVVSLVGLLGAAVDRRVRRGGVDHERLRGGRRVGVAGGVDRAHLERVRARRPACRGVNGDVAGGEGGAVDAALEASCRSRGGEREGRRGVVARARRGPRRASCPARRGSIEKVCVAGVASVLPAVSIARTSKVCVPSASGGGGERRGAGGEGGGVDAALERRAGLGRGEREGRRRVVAGRRRRAGDRRVRRGRVDRERRACAGVGVDVAGGVDRADLERVRAGGRAPRS